jgi:hypothetical protein
MFLTSRPETGRASSILANRILCRGRIPSRWQETTVAPVKTVVYRDFVKESPVPCRGPTIIQPPDIRSEDRHACLIPNRPPGQAAAIHRRSGGSNQGVGRRWFRVARDRQADDSRYSWVVQPNTGSICQRCIVKGRQRR